MKKKDKIGQAVRRSVKNSVKKKSAVTHKNASKEKEYVVINEFDTGEERKRKLVFVLVAFFSLALVIFWFWTIKNNIKNSDNTVNKEYLAEVNKVFTDFKSTFNDAKKTFEQVKNQTVEQVRLENIRAEIIKKLEADYDSEYWPDHISEIAGVSLQYPVGWAKQEEKNKLALTFKEDENIAGEIIITRKISDKDLALDSLLALSEKNEIFSSVKPENITIDDQAAWKYSTSGENNFSFLIVTSKEKNFYEINVDFNDKVLEVLIDRIISTIKFL